MSDLPRRFSKSPGITDSDSHHVPRRSALLPVANILSSILPGLGVPSPAMAGIQRSYAPWPVWRDSTTKTIKFMPLPKKRAVQFFHKARAFERQTRQKGKQDGALGRNGLLVFHTLIFDILDYATGRLDPAIETIARKACISISSVKRGLANLKRSGLLHWIRRAAETHDEKGRFCLKQDTNAYGIMPPSQWLRFFYPLPDAPPPHPSEWGAVPPLPSVIEQAAEETRHGERKTATSILESDPNDDLAAALASFSRAMDAKEKGAESLGKSDSSD